MPDTGDFDAALRNLQRARRLIDENGITYYSAGVDTTISWLLRETGQLAAARDIAERAVDAAERGGGALELEVVGRAFHLARERHGEIVVVALEDALDEELVREGAPLGRARRRLRLAGEPDGPRSSG